MTLSVVFVAQLSAAARQAGALPESPVGQFASSRETSHLVAGSQWPGGAGSAYVVVLPAPRDMLARMWPDVIDRMPRLSMLNRLRDDEYPDCEDQYKLVPYIALSYTLVLISVAVPMVS